MGVLRIIFRKLWWFLHKQSMTSTFLGPSVQLIKLLNRPEADVLHDRMIRRIE